MTRLEANLPYGNDTRVLAIVPAIAIKSNPGSRGRAAECVVEDESWLRLTC